MSFFYFFLLISTASCFLFNLPQLVQQEPAPQCCCQPPPPCPPPQYGPPPYAGQSYGQAYAGSQYPYRKARAKRASLLTELTGSSEDKFCNSPEIKQILKESVSASESSTRDRAMNLMKEHFETEGLVICTEKPFNFSISRDAEYCFHEAESFTCYGFLF